MIDLIVWMTTLLATATLLSPSKKWTLFSRFSRKRAERLIRYMKFRCFPELLRKLCTVGLCHVILSNKFPFGKEISSSGTYSRYLLDSRSTASKTNILEWAFTSRLLIGHLCITLGTIIHKECLKSVLKWRNAVKKFKRLNSVSLRRMTVSTIFTYQCIIDWKTSISND
jgi:hypothetical protein